MKVWKTGVLVRGQNSPRRGNYWPTVARIPDGRLAAVWSGGRYAHICPYGSLRISYSSDEGESWSPQAILLDNSLDDRDGGITAWNDKVVVTTFTNTRGFQREWATGPNSFVRTEEERRSILAHIDAITEAEEERDFGSFYAIGDGERFGTFRKLPITAPHGPIADADGNLFYIGSAFTDGNGKSDTLPADFHGLSEGIYFIISEDGENWEAPVAAPPAPDGAFLCEPHGFVCKDGSVFVGARAHIGGKATIYFNKIENGVFGEWKQSKINGLPPHFLRLRDGRILLTYGRREAPCGIRAKISEDEGRTWGEELIIRTDLASGDIGYPSSVQRRDGKILTVWYEYVEDDLVASIVYGIWEI